VGCRAREKRCFRRRKVGEGGERITQFKQIDESKMLEARCGGGQGMEPFSVFLIA